MRHHGHWASLQRRSVDFPADRATSRLSARRATGLLERLSLLTARRPESAAKCGQGPGEGNSFLVGLLPRASTPRVATRPATVAGTAVGPVSAQQPARCGSGNFSSCGALVQAQAKAPANFTVSFSTAYGDICKERRAKQALLQAYNEVLPGNDGTLNLKQYVACLQKVPFQRLLADLGIQPHLGVLIYKLVDRHGNQQCTINEFIDGIMELTHEFHDAGRDLDLKELTLMLEARRPRHVQKLAGRQRILQPLRARA